MPKLEDLVSALAVGESRLLTRSGGAQLRLTAVSALVFDARTQRWRLQHGYTSDRLVELEDIHADDWYRVRLRVAR